MIKFVNGAFNAPTTVSEAGRGYSYQNKPGEDTVNGRYEYPPSLAFAKRYRADLDEAGREFLVEESNFHAEATWALTVLEDGNSALQGANSDLQLRDYQIRGVRLLVSQHRVLLADDLGLGKTAQALVASTIVGGPILILAKSALMRQLADEVHKWTGKETQILTAGKGREGAFIDGQQDSSLVTITNWEALNTFKSKTLLLPWKVVIGDEAHLIKNPKAKRSRRAAKLMGRADHVYLLTGTPLERTPADLWHIMSVLRPGLYSSYWRWYNCFVDYFSLPHTPHIKIMKGSKNEEVLHDLLYPVYLRRLRGDVLPEVKEPQFVSVRVDLQGKQRRLYDLIAEEGYIGELDLEITNEMARMVHLRRAAVDASPLCKFEIPSAKINAALELIEGMPDEKIVVFSSFRQPAERLHSHLPDSYLYFSGPTTRDVDVGGILDKHQILISTFDSLSTGANLQQARILIFLDLPWSSSVYRQTVGRVVRLGQERQTVIYALTSRDTVDEHVAGLIEKKTEMFNEIMISNLVMAEREH